MRPGAEAGASQQGAGSDAEEVARLLGREPEGVFTVVVRGAGGHPVVIANEPFLRDGTPMPTRYWLVDPALRVLVGRLEAAGGVPPYRWAVNGIPLPLQAVGSVLSWSPDGPGFVHISVSDRNDRTVAENIRLQ